MCLVDRLPDLSGAVTDTFSFVVRKGLIFCKYLVENEELCYNTVPGRPGLVFPDFCLFYSPTNGVATIPYLFK